MGKWGKCTFALLYPSTKSLEGMQWMQRHTSLFKTFFFFEKSLLVQNIIFVGRIILKKKMVFILHPQKIWVKTPCNRFAKIQHFKYGTEMNISIHCDCKFLYLGEVMFHRQESFACNRRDDADVESSYPFLSISRHVRCGLAPARQHKCKTGGIRFSLYGL